MNHKRKKKKTSRACCNMCKPHKRNEFKDTYEHQTNQEKLARDSEHDQMEDLDGEDPWEELYDEGDLGRHIKKK